jgi:hypothetical protein
LDAPEPRRVLKVGSEEILETVRGESGVSLRYIPESVRLPEELGNGAVHKPYGIEFFVDFDQVLTVSL